MIGLLDGMSRATKLKFISTRHEQIAAHAADGYARLTHKASVLMCHLGPGLTNTLTGDGGFGTANPCVMATAVEQGIPAIWVVMDNSKFGTINGLENGKLRPDENGEFHAPDHGHTHKA